MIKLNLQLLKQQDRTMTDLEKRLNELYSDVSWSEKNEFSLLAGRLLAALTSDNKEDLEFIADHLAVSRETLDDLKHLMYNTGALMHELNERLIRE